MIGCTTQITTDAQLQYKLGTQFNGRRLWPLHVRCRRKTLTYAISSSDEVLFSVESKDVDVTVKCNKLFHSQLLTNSLRVALWACTTAPGNLIRMGYSVRIARFLYREPIITRSGAKRSPQRGPEKSPFSGSGAKPSAADRFLVLDVQWKRQICVYIPSVNRETEGYLL